MSESRRQAYLQAMGFDVWLARPDPADAPRLHFSPPAGGAASVLLVCERPEQPETRLAGDVLRAFGGKACWAWPEPDDQAGGASLDELVAEQLFTEVILFGAELADELARRHIGRVLGSARIEAAASLEELAASGPARQAFWRQLIRGRAH